MSTIKVENIRIASEAVSRPVTGVAASWANFNGSGTVAIRDSVNVGSITDTGVGIYDVNFSTSFTDDGYAATSSSTKICSVGNSTYTSSSLRLLTTNTAGTASDSQIVATSTHGDLA